ncbi:MAG: diguanylate cyclase (GGDEF)-like protein [Candidatus Poriferisodalaceae bacterium]
MTFISPAEDFHADQRLKVDVRTEVPTGRMNETSGVDRVNMSETPSELIQSGLLNDLPTSPAVALEILRLADDPDAGLAELASVLEIDPALSARLVSISNSAAYARSTEIATVKDAAVLLGARTLSLIALSFSLASNLTGITSSATLDLDVFWRRSLNVAAVGRHLGRSANRASADDAFLAGLLCYLGRLVLAKNPSPRYSALVADSNGWPSVADEEALLGFSSIDVTVAAAAEWGLPDRIGSAIQQAFSGAATTPGGEIPSLGELVGLGIVADDSINDPESMRHHEEFERRFEAFFGRDEAVLDGIAIAIGEASEILDAADPEDLDTDQLLTRARKKMFDSTMALAAMTAVQAEKVDTLERQRDDLTEAATCDPLTGLGNRRALDEAIQGEVTRRSRSNVHVPLGVMIADIDHFKSFNDKYGHTFGDRVLTATASALSSVVRTNERMYRHGGEEFILLMTNVDDRALAAIGERFRKAVEAETFEVDGKLVNVTVSIGLAAAPASDAESIAFVIDRADALLYKAKQAGRNCVVIEQID